jgi:hypothetical protein
MNMNCSHCQNDQLTIADFYTWKRKDGTPVPHKKCKKCFNLGKYEKKPKGWDAVPDITKAQVIELLADRRNKLTHIAEATGLPYASLHRWVSKGLA